MYDKFSDRARKVMQLANQEAQRVNHSHIGVGHVLVAIIKEGSGVAAKVMADMGVALGPVRRQLEVITPDAHGGVDCVILGKLPHTPGLKEAIATTVAVAQEMRHNYVGTEHLALGILSDRANPACVALERAGLGVSTIVARLRTVATVTRVEGEDALYPPPLDYGDLVKGRPKLVTLPLGVKYHVGRTRDGYYFRVESDSGCVETGVKTWAELCAVSGHEEWLDEGADAPIERPLE